MGMRTPTCSCITKKADLDCNPSFLGLRTPADFFQQPKLDLENITETMTVKTKELKIKGKINPKNNLTLNNEEVYADKDGNFEKDILLQTGFNTLTFKIKKFLGKEFTVTKQVFYEEEIATSSENIILQNEN